MQDTLAFYEETTQQALAQERPLLPYGRSSPQLRNRADNNWSWNTSSEYLALGSANDYINNKGGPEARQAARDAVAAARANISSDPLRLSDDSAIPLRDLPNSIHPGKDSSVMDNTAKEKVDIDHEPFTEDGSFFGDINGAKADLKDVSGMKDLKRLVKASNGVHNLPGGITGAASNGMQLSDVIATDAGHASITFSSGARYNYRALSTTSRAMAFLIEMKDTS